LDEFQTISDIISKYYTVLGLTTDQKTTSFEILDYDQNKFSSLVKDLGQVGYTPFIDSEDNHYRIRIANKQERGHSRIHINVILFFATVGSTLFSGYMLGKDWASAIAFSIALLAIIGTHETAHYFAARKHKVKATLPYFIPAPTFIGTFGAVINVKSPIPDRNALFDLGYSGPLAGLLVTIPVLLIGLSMSTVSNQVSNAILFEPPLLMQIISYFTTPALTQGQVLLMHPVAFAGWVGIVITMINLMPVAFLDGGHISRSIFNEKMHYIISIMGVAVTIILGWIPMAILMVLILILTKSHPGALDNVTPVSRWRKITAIGMLAILILCLSRIPTI
jgi:membrane-associated protease RseP (regulator of RpoE activity)